jgi:putative ABC transport system permease protein
MSLTPVPLTQVAVAGLVGLLLLALAVFGKVPISYNLRNLRVRWRTSLLTALAFTLVVGLMTVMLAFVNGMYRLTEGSGRPDNVVVLSEGGTDELFSNLSNRDTGEVEGHRGVLRDAEGRPLASREVYFIVTQPVPKSRGKRKRRFLPVRGLDDPARAGAVHRLELHPGGRWFGGAGVQPLPGDPAGGEQAVQAVLGEGVARDLGRDQGKKSLQVGDVFEAGPRKWAVVGILNSAGSTFDSEVWAKRQIVGPMFGKENYTTVVLRTADAETARATAEDLSANYRQCAVQALVETEYFRKLNATNQQFLVAIIAVTVTMGAGGVLGVMNTMFATVAQRAKDVAVLRILGFARRQVLASFFLEALCIALVGGLAGCAVGWLADGWTASSIVGSEQGHGRSLVLKLVVDGRVLLTGMLFALGMGCVGGLAPALWAMSLKPLHAVR